jgi:hypothetical protein
MELVAGRIVIVGDGEFSYETEDEFCHFASDNRLTHFVCMAMRPGFEELSAKLEHTHYKPLTVRNNLMHMRALLWNDIVWFVVSIPTEEKHLLEEVAGSCGMRVANGVPTMFGHGCRMQFPINGNNVFALENVAGHPIYQNDDRINSALRETEVQSAEKIRSGKMKKAN